MLSKRKLSLAMHDRTCRTRRRRRLLKGHSPQGVTIRRGRASPHIWRRSRDEREQGHREQTGDNRDKNEPKFKKRNSQFHSHGINYERRSTSALRKATNRWRAKGDPLLGEPRIQH